jgi:hypothetical protein
MPRRANTLPLAVACTRKRSLLELRRERSRARNAPGPERRARRLNASDRNDLYAASRLRPLARRLLRTFRPPSVFMRARNPCVRARRILEG